MKLLKIQNKKYIAIVVVLIATSLFSFQDRFFEIAKQIEIYNNLFKVLNINYIDEINPGDLTNKVINNTLKNLDPYTRFYNEQQMEDVRIRREGEYAGIGVSSWYTDNGIIIVNVKEGFPADNAGLKSGDLIISVNGQALKGMEKDQMAQTLKGSPDTAVSLKVKRVNTIKEFNFKLDKIIVSPVPFFDMIDTETGYIKLDRFTSSKATEDVRKAFIALEEKGMKQLVLDLRNNPGGSLYDAVNITNLFIEKDKIVVDTRGKIRGNSRKYKTKNLPLDKEIPIVVLINGRSASASEIVSGALQDYDRAVVMGSRSFGKGLVQRYFKLNYGTQMKATISKYYTPSGRCIQELDYASRDEKTGVVPKFSDGTINSFKTANGRKVYDGGGVLPDVIVDKTKKTESTKALLSSRSLFNFATTFVQQNPKADITTFSFTDANFTAFENYLREKDTAFVTVQEQAFKKTFNNVKNKNKISSSFYSLMQQVKTVKVDEVLKNKTIIKNRLQDEILEQYFYKKGMYQYHLKNDQTIQKATELLKNKSKYKSLLKG